MVNVILILLWLSFLRLLRFLCFWLSNLLRLLFLLGLGKRNVLQRLFYELYLAEDGLDLGLVDKSLEVPGDMRVLGAECVVEGCFK